MLKGFCREANMSKGIFINKHYVKMAAIKAVVVWRKK